MITPVENAVQDKFDVVEWNKLPLGPCDLNFRPPSGDAGYRWPSAITIAILCSVVVACLAPTTRFVFGQWITSSLSAPTAVLVAVSLAVFSALGWYQPIPTAVGVWNSLLSALLSATSVMIVWVVLLLLCVATSTEIAVAGLLLMSLPLTLFSGDALCTHYVFWTSANPLIDHKTMLEWRRLWSLRLKGGNRWKSATKRSTSAIERARIASGQHRQYRRSLLMVAGAFVLSPTSAIVFEQLQVAASAEWIIAGLILAFASIGVCIRLVEYPRALGLFLPALGSWLFFGQGKKFGPMVFQSPGGLPWMRQSLLVTTVSLTASILQPLLIANVSIPEFIRSSESATVPLFFLLLFVLTPVAATLGAIFYVAAPVLDAHHKAIEGENATERRKGWLAFDGYVDRLINSRNARERQSVFLGYVENLEFPVLLPTKLLFEHLHILGASGIAKTSLGLAPLAMQLIRRKDAAVVIIDGKGDQAFFNLARFEAAQTKKRFRWFTNKPRRSTFVFNPFTQQHLQSLSLEEVVGFVTQSMNLIHGMDYGRAWFTLLSRVSTKRTFAASDVFVQRTISQQNAEQLPAVTEPFAINSFRKLHEALKKAVQDNKELGNAQHICMAVEMLTSFEQLNLNSSLNPDHPAVKDAIHMPDVLANKEIVYFSLMGLMDLASVAEIARLALFSTLLAAQYHFEKTGKRPKVYVLIDEAQVVVGQNLSIVMEQARSLGVSIILSHQNLHQLAPPGGVDLRNIIWECTTNKLIFSARDTDTQKKIIQSSGQTVYGAASWKQTQQSWSSGDIGLQFAQPESDGEVAVDVGTSIGSRIELEDINRMNRDMNLAMLRVERSEDYAQLNGYATCRIEWPMNKDTYDARAERQPWPETVHGTISPSGWPDASENTIVTYAHPQITFPISDDKITINKLREMEDLLFNEGAEQ